MSKKRIEDIICSCGSRDYTVDEDICTVPGQVLVTIMCNGCKKLKGFPTVENY